MFAMFLIMLITPGMGIFVLYCVIRGLFGKHDKSHNHYSYHYVDDEEQRINEWGLDDDWRWGKL